MPYGAEPAEHKQSYAENLNSEEFWWGCPTLLDGNKNSNSQKKKKKTFQRKMSNGQVVIFEEL